MDARRFVGAFLSAFLASTSSFGFTSNVLADVLGAPVGLNEETPRCSDGSVNGIGGGVGMAALTDVRGLKLPTPAF